jgi:rhodanese-related sulfurtransferase
MKQMSAKEVEALLNRGKKLNIIDVREVNEVASSKIPGAVNMPLGLVEFRMNELDKLKSISWFATQEEEAAVPRSSLNITALMLSTWLVECLIGKGK